MPRRRLAAVPDTPGRVVLYVRVSALMGRGGEDFHSPTIQTAAMRRVTAGLHEIAVVEDIDQTGTNFSREGIEKIRAMAEARQVDAIAVYDVSRLGRNVLESLLFLRELADKGVTIISACEQIDTSTPAGEMMLINMLNIAQYRAREISRNWSALIARRAERGQHHGRPLGYVHRDKALVPDPVMGPAMREAFRRYGAGDPLGGICRYLAAVRGRPVIASNLKKCYRNPVYLGYVIAAGEQLPGQHEALVDEDTWQRVQTRLAADSSMPPRHVNPTWSLVGITYCPWGHKIQRESIVRRGVREHRLACGMARCGTAGPEVRPGVRAKTRGGPKVERQPACEGVGRPVLERVEAEVLRQVAEYAQRLRSDHAARAARLARVTSDRVDRDALKREVTRANTAMTRLTTRWAMQDPDLPDAVYQASMAELRAARDGAAAELARLGTEKAPPPDPIEAAGAVDALLQMWPRMTPAEQSKALRSVVSRVVVRGAARWREPEADRVKVHFRW